MCLVRERIMRGPLGMLVSRGQITMLRHMPKGVATRDYRHAWSAQWIHYNYGCMHGNFTEP